MLAKEYPPNVYGGAGVHLRHLAHELSRIMDVEVKCFGNQNIKEKHLKVKGYQPCDRLKECNDPHFYLPFSTISINLLMARDMIDTDIIHSHTWYASFAGFLAKRLYKLPLVVTCHSIEPSRPWKEEQLGRAYQLSSWLEKTAIESADRVIAVSKNVKEDILKHFNITEDRIVVIYNGIDLNKWKETLTDFTKKEYGIDHDYILFVGRTTRQKGMIYLIEAADYIEKDVQIVICTSAPDTKEVEEEMMQKMIQKKNIIWINKLLREEQYIELYSGAVVFVCPSIYEPFGIVNIEAMACKTPIVASAVGGIKEVVIHEETGMLVEPAKPKQLAYYINHLLRNRELARKLGENGRKRVKEHFSWTSIAQQTKNLYESIL